MPPAGAVWGIVSSRHAGPVDESRACLRNRPAPTYSLTNPYPLTFHVSILLKDSFLSTLQLIGITTRFIVQISAATDKTSQRLTRCLHPASPSIPSSTTPSLSLNSKVSQRHRSFRPGPYHGLHERTRAGSKSRTCSYCCSALLLLGGLHSGLVGRPTVPRATREPLVESACMPLHCSALAIPLPIPLHPPPTTLLSFRLISSPVPRPPDLPIVQSTSQTH
jgi:hypothetical protein